ncbi:hypothetical protein Afil01_28480 [Actinorhabdospora filicis]|uniref:Uncharacterized protein n=1 Tax=Actinorhabdospora filicis TaxID=1785913 RepID=A0A9W6SNW6_9ACTN|nr:hypothetical protein [Actinorhabdospora filicis]GLZ78041.1 hypothetical protein Afil01_28480 [Actinorhabdospora filicis]
MTEAFGPAGEPPAPRNPAADAVFQNPYDAPPGCRGAGRDAPACTAPVAAVVQPRRYPEFQTRMCAVHAAQALEDPDILIVVYGEESFADAKKKLRNWMN